MTQLVSIVVPTFREAANLPALVERIHGALSGSGIEWELLLVDDDSDDGSQAVVAELARRLPVRMVVRRDRPRDLSLAVVEGIRLARFDRLVVMDADLSHPPERILDLLGALDADCDIVIGSRYVSGGRVDRTWSAWRFLNSRLAVRLAMPLVNCSDPMAGFFATDRRLLPELQALRPIGYKIALELMVRGRLRVKEVPIDFSDRTLGTSKMNWRQQVNFVRHLYRLYLYRFGGLARLLCFGLVGASGFVVDLGCYLGLQGAGVEHLNLGSALFEADRFEEGLATCRIVVSQRPDSAKALTNVGREFIKLRQLEEAEAHLLRARQLDPRGITAHQNLAEVFREQARYAEAVASYRAVLEIDPGYVLAYARMGMALIEAPRHDEALEAMKQALEPDLPTAGARQDHHHPCLRRQSHERRVPPLPRH